MEYVGQRNATLMIILMGDTQRNGRPAQREKSAPYAHTCERINNEQIGNKEEEKQQTRLASAMDCERWRRWRQ